LVVEVCLNFLDRDRIQKRNDDFRASRQDADLDVLWMTHPALPARGRQFREAVFMAIREQVDFSHDEIGFHDYGAVVVDGLTIEWSIIHRSAKGVEWDPDRATHSSIVVGEDYDDFGL
jgi:hypothetical protein